MQTDRLENLTPTSILGLTIIGEARGEPIEGQVAVGSVIRNRLYTNTDKYRTYHDVCLYPRQFSCWNLDDKNRLVLDELATLLLYGDQLTDIFMKQCMWVASGIVNWDIRDNTNGATHYLTSKLYWGSERPSWANRAKKPIEFGKQVFFDV